MRKIISLTLFIVLAALLLAACGDAPAAAPSPAVVSGAAAKGQELFTSACAACHGPNGEGVQGLGKNMHTSEFIKGKTDAELLAFIKVGRGADDPLNTTGVAMPPKGGNSALTDAELQDIVAFIRTINGQ